MERAQAKEFEALFDHKRAALALVCLHANGGPMRWTDVRDAMSARTGTAVGDKAASRALQALQQLGLASLVDGHDGGRRRSRKNRMYALTPQGVERARWVEKIFVRLPNPPEHPDGQKPSRAPPEPPPPGDAV
jgi:DNA-binding PadR family transcriptional regulator